MDPVTIIGIVASVADLIHISASVVGIIKTFKDGNKYLTSLSNEISIFAEALAGFERVLRSRATVHRISGSAIESVLNISRSTVKDLELRLKQINSYESSAVRRAKWVQHASRVDKLRERLREQNAMLQTFLSITHAETFLALATQYPQYMLSRNSTEAVAVEDEKTKDSTRLQVPEVHGRERRLSATSSSATSESISDARSSMESLSIVSSISSVESIIATPQKGLGHKASNDVLQVSKTVMSESGSSFDLSKELSTDYGNDAQEIRQACRYDCHCECHVQTNSTKPAKGFAKFMVAKVQCTETRCQNNLALQKSQAMQSVSFRKALSQVMSSRSIKVRYDLNTYRMVCEGSDAMRHVKHGNLEKLKACIESGQATIWDTAPDGWSLLHTAAYNRQLPIVKYLLGLGIDTEVADIGSRKPADLAILKSIGQDATKVERDVVEVFSERDDCLSDFEFTPIHIAVLELYSPKDPHRPSLEKLIKVIDDANNAPVNTDWTSWKRRFRTSSPLFADIIEYYRASAFEQSKGRKIIHNLLDQKDKKFSWTPLHWAASAGRVEKMKVLVEHGADPTILSNLNANIIHAAAESKMSRGLAGALDIWRRCSDQLNINQTNRWVETPLHVAAWCSSACVKLLLEAGADPGVREENGQVPLHCAGLSGRGSDRQEIVSLLCGTQSREHINMQDYDGRPPLFDFLDDPECIRLLARHGAKLDIVDDSGKNAFHHACIQDEAEALATMLQLADETWLGTARDHDGNTPLLEGLSHSSIDCAMKLLELDDVGEIISKDGWAAVHYAAHIGNADLLETVLKHPSFMKGMKTMDGKKADIIAMEAGNWHGKVKELIREHDSFGWRE